MLKTLLALSIHALVLDAAAEGRPCQEDTIRRIRLADIEDTVTKRPSHELLAGLPRLSEDEQLRVDALRVLVYDDASALSLGRLSQLIRITLLNVAAGLSTPDPVCADVV
ncbi:hypothetical protein [Streptomyces sp. NPDC001530]|uniref:hypothetical protein n=1 Tax=Streptomyces sp. NPDC001530 TaxID=3364582 RepID=UPI0036859121